MIIDGVEMLVLLRPSFLPALKTMAFTLMIVPVALAQSTAIGENVSAAGYLMRSDAMASALNARWLSHKGGLVDWSEVNAWQRFVIIDALADYVRLSHDRRMLPVIRQAVVNHHGLDGNDDDLWAVIASLDVYGITKDQALLAYGERQFDHLASNYWDQVCGGGLWWDHKKTYKNAITNELFMYAATVLYLASGKKEYLAWAKRTLSWFNATGMINSDDLVNDGLNSRCVNNHRKTYTYNQGVILGGLTNLYKITGTQSYLEQAMTLAKASTSGALAPDGILREPIDDLKKDAQSFKGIYVRHLGYLYAEMPADSSRAAIALFLKTNAAQVWKGVEKRHDKLVDGIWKGGGGIGAASQASGIDLFNAASLVAGEPAGQ